MICSVCGSEFNTENFDVCPYCLSPVGQALHTSKNFEEEQIDTVIDEKMDNVLDSENETKETFVKEIDTYNDEHKIENDESIKNTTALENVMIDESGLSVRAINALKRENIYTLNDLIQFSITNNIAELKNVGVKTVQEIEELIYKTCNDELDVIKIKIDDDITTTSTEVFENISSDADNLKVEALIELGVPRKAIKYLLKNNIVYCGGLRHLNKRELTEVVGRRYSDEFPKVVDLLEKDIISLFSYVLNKYCNSREFDVFLRRAKGETLQEIADKPTNQEGGKVTRERVRQIESSFAKAISPFVRELFLILKGTNKFVSVQDLLDIFDNDDYDQVLLYACKGLEEFEFLDFGDIFVEKQEEFSVEEKLLAIITEIVGDGIDIHENQDTIEDVLIENKLDFINIETVVGLLKKNNYYVYGNFVVKGKNYSTIYKHVIKNYFRDGIKLSQSSSEGSEDLIKLRKIINEKYKGVILPSNDRNLSATLARNGLVLRDRGRYISEELLTLDEGLMEEIRKYIDEKESNKVFYNEIYSDYEGALRVLCGVDNYNYLHGILSFRYQDVYEFNRDYLIKKGVKQSQNENLSDRIYAYICSMGRPISKAELFQKFRGFTNVMLTMQFSNDKRLLQWDYNYFTCTGILDIKEQDILDLRKCITELLDENQGYTSDALLFDKVSEYRPDFIEKNKIQSDKNLHYIVAYLFAEEINFRRPHIGEKGRVDISSTKNVALYLLGNPDEFTYEQYTEIVNNMKWSHVTASIVLTEMEEDYVRVTMDKYIKKTVFEVPQQIVNSLRNIIKEKMENGILSLINLDMDEFPDWEYSWNEFIIESIVKKYYTELDVIHPIIRDRRYQRGIIVEKEKQFSSYSQIVAYKMIITGCQKMTESQFLSFLIVHNLARKAIPSELNKSEFIKKERDFYIVELM